MFQRELHAEPAIDQDSGNFLAKAVNFRFIHHRHKNDDVKEIFKRSQAKNFELSLLDNRIIKLQLLDMAHGGYVEYTIIFSNVHKKHQFAELFNLEDVNVHMLAKIPGILTEE